MRRHPWILLIGIVIGLIVISACGAKQESGLEEQQNKSVVPETGAEKSAGEISDNLQNDSQDSVVKAESEQKETEASAEDGSDQKDNEASEKSGKTQQGDPSSKPAGVQEKGLTEEQTVAKPADKAVSEEKGQVHTVEIMDFAFSPEKLTIKAGDTIKFINKDAVRHSATADGKAFDTGLLGQDEAKEVAFSKEGEFSYFCLPHPGMKGTIVVSAN